MQRTISATVNPLDGLLGYRLRRVTGALMALLGAELARLDLRPSEASILVLIAHNPGIRQSEIGRLLGIQRANMAPLIGSLERRSLVGREPVDGRSHGLVVTLRGDRIAAAAQRVMNEHDQLIRTAISDSGACFFEEALTALSLTPSPDPPA